MLSKKEELKTKLFPLAAPLIASQLELTEEEVVQKDKDKSLVLDNQIQNSFEEIWQNFVISLRPKESPNSQGPLDSNEFSLKEAEDFLKKFQGRFIYVELANFYLFKLNHLNFLHLGDNIGQAFLYGLFHCLGNGFKPLRVFNDNNKKNPVIILGDSITPTKPHTYYYLKPRHWHLLLDTNQELNFEAVKFSILLDFLDMKRKFLGVDPGIRFVKIKGENMKKSEVVNFIYDKLKESFRTYNHVFKGKPNSKWVFTEGSANYVFPLDDPQRCKEGISILLDTICSCLDDSFGRLIWTSTTEKHIIDVHAPHNLRIDRFQISISSEPISSETKPTTEGVLKALRLLHMEDIEDTRFKFQTTSLHLKDQDWKPEDIDMNLDELIKKYSTENNEKNLLCEKLQIHYNKDMFWKAILHLDGGIDESKLLQGQLSFNEAIDWSLEFALKLKPKYPAIYGKYAKKHESLDTLEEIAILYKQKWEKLCQRMKVPQKESKIL